MTATTHFNPADLTLLFRDRGPDGERFLVDGLGFVTPSLEEASRFVVQPGGKSFRWSRFDAAVDRVDALIPLEILDVDPATAAVCWGLHQWSFPRDQAGSLDLREITLPLIRHLLVPGGPFAAVRVLWRDTDEHVRNFGISCQVRGVREREVAN
ncbi:hypothetical protein [Luteolibacter marinus]|uniref:hypothetical protein n=1 Tax=Luteolibacter marinus TaxID=2776705 RepID=UPI00186906A1|nr:hypothetical protein [Luteolibacter marinus]